MLTPTIIIHYALYINHCFVGCVASVDDRVEALPELLNRDIVLEFGSDDAVRNAVLGKYVVIIVEEQGRNAFALVFRGYAYEVEFHRVVLFLGFE